MSEIIIVNEAPPGPNQVDDNYFMWRAANELMNAGWLFVGSSNGTTFSLVTSNWGTYAGSADQANAWICLVRPDNTNGFCFWRRNVAGMAGSNPSGSPSRVITYTTAGWNTAGASASTPPVPVGTTHYVRGDASNGGGCWFGGNAGAASIVVTRMNFVIRDPATDGSFVFYGFNNASQMPHYFCYSRVYPATQHGNVGDPFVFVVGHPYSSWQSGANPGLSFISSWKAVDAQPVFGAAMSCFLRRVDNGQVMVDATATYRDRYVSANNRYPELIFVITTQGGQETYKGWAQEVPYAALGTTGDFFENKLWTRGYGEFWLPWDGVPEALLTR